MLWSSIPNKKGHTKINKQDNKYLYNQILHHPQVVQYPIANDCLKMYTDGHYEPQLVTKFLLKLNIWEVHNSMVIFIEEGGLKEARDVDNNIMFNDSTLQSILSPQIMKMSACFKVMCGYECCTSSKSIHL